MTSERLIQKIRVALSRRTETSAISDKNIDEEPPTSTILYYPAKAEKAVVFT